MGLASLNTDFHFPLLGEPLSLDLVNTRIRKDGMEVDLLDRPAALAAWLAAEADRLPWSGNIPAPGLKAVQELRGAIAVLLAARRAGTQPPSAAVRAVNRVLSQPVPTTKLVWTSAGPQRKTRWVLDDLLHIFAMDAVGVLTGPQAKLLRVCEHPDCILQFLALNPRRRWCSAAVCGNRARVARHYHRHQANP